MCAQTLKPIPAAVDPVGALLAQVGQLTGQRDRAYRTLRAIERYCEPASGRVLSGRRNPSLELAGRIAAVLHLPAERLLTA